MVQKSKYEKVSAKKSYSSPSPYPFYSSPRQVPVFISFFLFFHCFSRQIFFLPSYYIKGNILCICLLMLYFDHYIQVHGAYHGVLCRHSLFSQSPAETLGLSSTLIPQTILQWTTVIAYYFECVLLTEGQILRIGTAGSKVNASLILVIGLPYIGSVPFCTSTSIIPVSQQPHYQCVKFLISRNLIDEKRW